VLNNSVRDCTEIVDADLGWIQLSSSKRRVEENRDDSKAARSLYIAHVHEHHC
jgi:hypothetical protein